MGQDTVYDIIIAGGGTSGCVIAGRLAAMDKNLKILVLEAGEHTLNKPECTQPARYTTHFKPGSKTLSFYESKPNEHLNGRAIVTATGRCLGGGSSVNFAMYNRAVASDFDDWETKFGNNGWSSKDMIPLLKKTETYQVKEGKSTHGYSGPLKVSYGGAYTNVGRQFLEVAAQYDKVRKATDDPNALYESDVYGRWPKFIDAETGHRSDVPHHFIYNQNYENLSILTGKKVRRVVFEGDRAVGVEYSNDTISNPGADESLLVARASRLVVISAGAFGSPAILERSGIGGRDILQRHGVDVKVDLPGVGENYQDHHVLLVPYLASDEAETLDALFRGDEEEEQEQTRLYENGVGLIATNGFDAGIKMRPTDDDLEVLGSAFNSRWETFFADSVDKPVIWLGAGAVYLGGDPNAPPRKYFTMAYYADYPESMGSVHISSSTSDRRLLPRCLKKPLPFNKSAQRADFRKRLSHLLDAHWKTSPRYHRVNRIIHTKHANAFKRLLFSLPRKLSTLLVWLITGHLPLQSYLHRIGKAASTTCLSCESAPETVQHYLFRCPTFNNARVQLARKCSIAVRNLSLARILTDPKHIAALFRYVQNTRRLQHNLGELPAWDPPSPSK